LTLHLGPHARNAGLILNSEMSPPSVSCRGAQDALSPRHRVRVRRRASTYGHPPDKDKSHEIHLRIIEVRKTTKKNQGSIGFNQKIMENYIKSQENEHLEE
jgi:hypothetical protein